MYERWKPVPGWEGLYSVSSLGRVRSEERVITGSFTSRWGTRAERTVVRKQKILSANIDTGGYAQVVLQCSNRGMRVTETVHRLVLSAFRRPPAESDHGMHRNDIRHDNRLANLKWGTKRENTDDMVKKGRCRPGVAQNKLTPQQRKAIMAQPTALRKELAETYGVSLSTINKLRAKAKQK